MKYIGIAVGIFVVDALTPFIPLTALTLVYISIAKPNWFKNFVDSLYE